MALEDDDVLGSFQPLRRCGSKHKTVEQIIGHWLILPKPRPHRARCPATARCSSPPFAHRFVHQKGHRRHKKRYPAARARTLRLSAIFRARPVRHCPLTTVHLHLFRKPSSPIPNRHCPSCRVLPVLVIAIIAALSTQPRKLAAHKSQHSQHSACCSFPPLPALFHASKLAIPSPRARVSRSTAAAVRSALPASDTYHNVPESIITPKAYLPSSLVRDLAETLSLCQTPQAFWAG